MERGRDKYFFLGISILMLTTLVLTGCSGGLDLGLGGSDSGEISGQITYLEGNLEDVKVLLLEDIPQDEPSSYSELNIYKEVTADSSEGTYFFNDVIEGTYYVAAYKDVIADEELNFDGTEPYGIYMVGGEEAQVVVGDELVSGIDFEISSNSGEISGQITYLEGNLEDVKVLLLEDIPQDEPSSYSELNIYKEVTADSSEGTYFFNDVIEGTYYVAAYKDVIADEELNFDGTEPYGIYMVGGEEAQVVVGDELVSGIDFEISIKTG